MCSRKPTRLASGSWIYKSRKVWDSRPVGRRISTTDLTSEACFMPTFRKLLAWPTQGRESRRRRHRESARSAILKTIQSLIPKVNQTVSRTCRQLQTQRATKRLRRLIMITRPSKTSSKQMACQSLTPNKRLSLQQTQLLLRTNVGFTPRPSEDRP